MRKEAKSIYADVEIANSAAPQTTQTVRALVDTGATLSVFPASTLDRLGVERLGERRFQGAGGVLSRDTGGVRMRYQDSVAGVPVVFGEENEPTIIGVTALQSLGCEVDPVAGRLTRLEALKL